MAAMSATLALQSLQLSESCSMQSVLEPKCGFRAPLREVNDERRTISAEDESRSTSSQTPSKFPPFSPEAFELHPSPIPAGSIHSAYPHDQCANLEFESCLAAFALSSHQRQEAQLASAAWKEAEAHETAAVNSLREEAKSAEERRVLAEMSLAYLEKRVAGLQTEADSMNTAQENRERALLEAETRLQGVRKRREALEADIATAKENLRQRKLHSSEVNDRLSELRVCKRNSEAELTGTLHRLNSEEEQLTVLNAAAWKRLDYTLRKCEEVECTIAAERTAAATCTSQIAAWKQSSWPAALWLVLFAVGLWMHPLRLLLMYLTSP